jgi:Glycosyltransferase family 17
VVGEHVTRIFDSFLYSGIGTEPDLLECRLRELDGYVSRHVIVEGNRTFQGMPKPYTFEEDAERFKPWADSITYVRHTPSSFHPGKQPGKTWAREHSSRMAVHDGLQRDAAREGDIILHGDVDEIPSREAIESLREHASEIVPCKLELRFFMFAVDWQVPWPWHAPSVMRYGQLHDMTQLRETGWGAYPYVRPAGWHMTWLGGEEASRAKVHAFSHDEAIPETEDGLAAGRYLTEGKWWTGSGRGTETQFEAVEVDETWPQWIRDSWDPVARKPRGPAPDIWFRPREGAC